MKEWIVTHLRDIKATSDVARIFNTSPETLRKRFVRIERVPLSRFVQLARIEAMKDLLASTDKKCTEIGFEVGFAREDTAVKVFHRFTGESMTEFRRIHAGKT